MISLLWGLSILFFVLGHSTLLHFRLKDSESILMNEVFFPFPKKGKFVSFLCLALSVGFFCLIFAIKAPLNFSNWKVFFVFGFFPLFFYCFYLIKGFSKDQQNRFVFSNPLSINWTLPITFSLVFVSLFNFLNLIKDDLIIKDKSGLLIILTIAMVVAIISIKISKKSEKSKISSSSEEIHDFESFVNQMNSSKDLSQKTIDINHQTANTMNSLDENNLNNQHNQINQYNRKNEIIKVIFLLILQLVLLFTGIGKIIAVYSAFKNGELNLKRLLKLFLIVPIVFFMIIYLILVIFY